MAKRMKAADGVRFANQLICYREIILGYSGRPSAIKRVLKGG